MCFQMNLGPEDRKLRDIRKVGSHLHERFVEGDVVIFLAAAMRLLLKRE
jgi:hypothetical protein